METLPRCGGLTKKFPGWIGLGQPKKCFRDKKESSSPVQRKNVNSEVTYCTEIQLERDAWNIL